MHPSCYLDEPHFVHASFDVTEFEEMWHTHTLLSRKARCRRQAKLDAHDKAVALLFNSLYLSIFISLVKREEIVIQRHIETQVVDKEETHLADANQGRTYQVVKGVNVKRKEGKWRVGATNREESIIT